MVGSVGIQAQAFTVIVPPWAVAMGVLLVMAAVVYLVFRTRK